MKKFKNTVLEILAISLCIACGGSDDGGEVTPPEATLPPSAASLIFPEDNTECNEGTLISETQSEVVFQWNASENTDFYTVSVKNLNTGNTLDVETRNAETGIIIERGVPYSWFVTSRAAGTAEIGESSVYKFYNAGVPVTNHSPFPAEAITPRVGESVAAGAVVLSWESTDIDDDIVSYELVLDQNNPPATSLQNTAESSYTFEAAAGTVYYWRVVTTDAAGNRAPSEVFQFKAD